MNRPISFIENLSILAWFLEIWPRLVGNRLRGKGKGQRCYIIDGGGLADALAKASAMVTGLHLERLSFQARHLKDEEGTNLDLRITYGDIQEVQERAVNTAEFQDYAALPERLPMFLSKSIASYFLGRTNLRRILMTVQVCANQAQLENEITNGAVLFLERRPWVRSIGEYSKERGITLVPVRPALNIRGALRRRVPRPLVQAIQARRQRSFKAMLSAFTASPQAVPETNAGSSGAPKVAAEFYGQLNLDDPKRHSEVSFWQDGGPLDGKDLLVAFGSPLAPLDASKLSELEKHGMGAIVLHPGAATIDSVPVFSPPQSVGSEVSYIVPAQGHGSEAQWLGNRVSEYRKVRNFWRGAFSRHNVKVFATWYRNDASHVAVADALRSLGGVSVVYQRTWQDQPSALTAVAADVFFGYSAIGAEVERQSNSDIDYYVATGYLGDHRFKLLVEDAKQIREDLERNGAKKVLALFDESNQADTRWGSGFQAVREYYSFFVEKLLSTPWFGLVLKPKNPLLLQSALGPVWELLQLAVATGRCRLIGGSDGVQGWNPPALAALAADVSVHGHLNPGTAGMEAALAGVPSLLLDPSGWTRGRFYDLGVGNVVFHEMDALWDACEANWSGNRTDRLGDWTPLLDELDPFRDGKATERMGTYINWLIQGFHAGFDRETVMADAAGRYTDMWGSDKIIRLNQA